MFGLGKKKESDLPEGLTWQVDEAAVSETSSDGGSSSWGTQCAWCLQAAGLPMGDGSHGICEMHSAQMIQRYQAGRTERRRHR